MHCCAALDTADAGVGAVGEQRPRPDERPPLTALRRDEIGFVFQSYNLVPTLTAAENIALPAGDRRPHARRRSGTTRWSPPSASATGSPTSPTSSPAASSSGWRWPARWSAGPRIVFADEPTGNLDSRSGAEVLDLLRRSVDDHGQTVVMVTHDPVAAAYTDRVVFLADGRVVDELRDPDQRAGARGHDPA